MEEERRQAAAAAGLITGGGRGGGAEHHDDDDVARGSRCCNLCGDVGFRQALLPCGARGCSRLQHTYCGSRYCPDATDDVKRWRCEWCAPEDGGEEEGEDSSRKRSRRAPPYYYSLSPREIKQAPEERSTDKETRTGCHREWEEKRESTLPTARAHAPRPTSPSVSTQETDVAMMHKDKQSINPGAGGGSGGGSRALDRWKNLAKRTRLGGKKYKLLADVLC